MGLFGLKRSYNGNCELKTKWIFVKAMHRTECSQDILLSENTRSRLHWGNERCKRPGTYISDWTNAHFRCIGNRDGWCRWCEWGRFWSSVSPIGLFSTISQCPLPLRTTGSKPMTNMMSKNSTEIEINVVLTSLWTSSVPDPPAVVFVTAVRKDQDHVHSSNPEKSNLHLVALIYTSFPIIHPSIRSKHASSQLRSSKNGANVLLRRFLLRTVNNFDFCWLEYFHEISHHVMSPLNSAIDSYW